MLNLKMINIKYLSIFFIFVMFFFALSNNKDYVDCMEATKHNYISQAGIDHISAQCEAFIKKKIMVK